MSELKIGSATTGDMASVLTDYSVDPETTDAAGEQNETEWLNTEFDEQLGYYKNIPEIRAVVDAKARWTLGKGYTSDEITEITLARINGFGKETFNMVLENLERVKEIAGDSFAEIVRDKEDVLRNLKPLDPSTIKVVANSKGIIKRYEQISKINKKAVKTFLPEQIFHLSRNRTADEIHGIPLADSLKMIVDMKEEVLKDWRESLHRNGRPRIVWELDTDETDQISTFKTLVSTATEEGEHIYIPQTTAKWEVLSVPPNSTMNPLPTLAYLDSKFYQTAGVPQIIVGGSQEITEANAKILYLAFEQTIKEQQRELEEQVLAQLNLEINLEFPASLENEILNNQAKSETMQASTPEDTGVKGTGLGGAS